MSRKVFSVIAITLALVLAAIFLLLPGATSRDGIGTADQLLPGLAARVNDVDRIVAVGAGDTVIATLNRNDDTWTVSEFAGLPGRPGHPASHSCRAGAGGGY